MILALDVGNTNIVLGGAVDGKIEFVARFATDRGKTADEYAIMFSGLFNIHNVDISSVEGAIISSVVPPITNTLKQAVQLLCGLTPLVVGPGLKTGLNIRIDNPAQAGSDLIADSVAAMTRYPLPAVVIDMGTATTLSTLNKQGEYIGNIIFPGVELSIEALASRSAQLPHISLDAPERVIGKNTIDSMRSGIVLGNASMLDGMIDRIEAELGEQVSVVATGGLAATIIPHCRRKIEYNADLVLLGLLDIYERNS